MLASLAVLTISLAMAPPPRLSFEFRASPVANLTYHLHCMAGLMVCSQDAFKALWQERIGWHDDDDKALDRWRETVEMYREHVEFTGRGEDSLPFPTSHGPSWDLGDKVTIAGLVATDVEDYRRNLTLLISPLHVPALLEVVERVWPRFEAWWKAHGRAEAEKAATGYSDVIRLRALPELCDRVADFYGADLPPRAPVYFHIIFRPRSSTERRTRSLNTNATVLENHAIIEAPDGEAPDNNVDVVMHELFHYFYWMRPGSAHAREVAQFAASSEPAAVGLYTIFDEAMAAALGNGIVAEKVHGRAVVAERLAKGGQLYDEPFIDAMGRALMRPMEARLAAGGKLDDAFIAQYLALARRTLGAKADHPHLLLKLRNIVYENKQYEPASKKLKRAFRGVSTSTQREEARWVMERMPRMSGVVLLAPGEVALLRAHAGLLPPQVVDEIERAAKQGPVIWGVKRNAQADVYVLVAADNAGMEKLVDTFVAEHVRFEGRLVR